ncbi:MAG: LysM peptidoglycan-binding domain-containing protein [Bacteroidia bacterium]|jgi:D-alanyl-D-alanine carboxypeptidase|nr:LysM peptidoglycan-binding domain-containing protein [Bacteroidia bacterium]MBP7245570.1 LysM peptidoglycan-binding domain-containing protein [Bacteroidia bacterium]
MHSKSNYSQPVHQGFFLMTLLMVFSFFQGSAASGRTDTLPPIKISNFNFDKVDGLISNEREIRAGLLYDVERNKILWEKEMDSPAPIASLTKMMVCLLAIEDLNSGSICLDDRITVTRTYKKRLRRRRYTTYTVEEKYYFEDLLKMALVASHNESTVWIAKHCSGDVSTFVSRMNAKAIELGMTQTQYYNTSGLPGGRSAPDNSSTARDQLLLGIEMLKYPKLVEISSIPFININNGKGNISFRNHNGLVINYGQEVDGIKTGYTRAAGFCLVASAKRGEHRLISVVFGCRGPWIRNGIVANMMNTYYDAIKLGRLGETNPELNDSKLFLDSVQRGLAFIRPHIELKAPDNASDESYAYTYKTVTQKVKKGHRVRNGESLGKIANRYNVTVNELSKWNKLRSSTIRPGQTLYVYSTVKKRIQVKLVVDPEESVADLETTPDSTEQIETTLKSEHTPHKNGELKSDSTIETKDSIKQVPSKKRSEISKTKSEFIYHIVQPGDTLWNIAQRYRTDLKELKKINKIGRSNGIRSGTKLKIPVNGG